MSSNQHTEKIKRKYGANAFKRWGAKGGSPILKAYSQGRVTIHKKPTRKHRG